MSIPWTHSTPCCFLQSLPSGAIYLFNYSDSNFEASTPFPHVVLHITNLKTVTWGLFKKAVYQEIKKIFLEYA
jgi:hypothetical protein